jgi:hypothetical protein
LSSARRGAGAIDQATDASGDDAGIGAERMALRGISQNFSVRGFGKALSFATTKEM